MKVNAMSANVNSEVSLTEAYILINGMPWTLNGIAGTLQVTKGPHGQNSIEHHPNAAGKRSEAYRETKSQLRDDWFTTLDEDFDELGRIFEKVGKMEVKTFRNVNFKTRDYEATNIVACQARKAPGKEWEECDASIIEELNLTQLWIQGFVRFFGYM